MSERFYPEELPVPEREVSVQIRFGKEIVTVSNKNTLIRRFMQGNGEFDHCVHVDTDGKLRAFTPDARTLEELTELGFPVRIDLEIDDATITHYSMLQAHGIDHERDKEGL